MRKILYIHQYFKTPEDGGAVRSYFISRGMTDRGMAVEMITSHNSTCYEQKIVDGIHVHYLPVKYSNELSFLKRYFAFLKFASAAISLSKRLPRPQLVFATSTPLSVGLVALWLKWRWKIPYIFEVRDLWPEAPIQLGIIRSRVLKLIFQSFEKISYKNARHIIALSPDIRNSIVATTNSADVSLISNMANTDFFQVNRTTITEKNDLVIGYFGTFGLANHLEYILDIANECQKVRLPVNFKLVGEGARKKLIQSTAFRMGIENVEFLPHKSLYEIGILMNEVDACITTFLDLPVLRSNSPNKFFDGLAAGKLCIVNTKGWLKGLVEEYQCGFYTDPINPDKFPELIEPFISDNDLLRKYQKNARNLALKEFSKNDLVKRICDLILEQTLNS